MLSTDNTSVLLPLLLLGIIAIAYCVSGDWSSKKASSQVAAIQSSPGIQNEVTASTSQQALRDFGPIEPEASENAITKSPRPFAKPASIQENGPQRRQESFQRRGRRRQAPSDRSEYPMWEVEESFAGDIFTFVRIQFDSGGARGGGWANDYPDCDWNFSVRLHELTSLEVDPNGKVIRLTDDELFDYPWVFMSNVNRMNLDDSEVTAMREYCLKGGFVMGDDFWAPRAWQHVRSQMKRVFPNREPRELRRDHEIFNLVYRLEGVPQVPSIFAWQQGHKFEYWHGDPQGDEAPHFWGYFDDNDRLMALMCHNNDIGDGWEREGENKEYFKEYSERVSYPLGINIITYVMTH